MTAIEQKARLALTKLCSTMTVNTMEAPQTQQADILGTHLIVLSTVPLRQ
ncbi:hypothetical protein VCHA51O444_10458 [Vibrio chagasii]|nr:hypothetical protein VCHA51O444_10458 [Vibrio chagasii]